MVVLRRHLADIDQTALVPADLELTMDDFEATISEITPTALRELTIEMPRIAWSDIGGLDDIKRILTENVLWPVEHRDLFERFGTTPPRGIVLYGPPGTGKTLLARALATEAKVNFVGIRGPELLSKYVGESERAVREIFERARQAAPAILFFDELDSLVPLRGRATGNDVTDRVVAQFLTEIDGVSPLRNVWLIGATNRLDMVDPALLRPGRLELQLAIGLPDLATRRAVLDVHTRQKPLARDVDFDALAEMTEGLSSADLAALCAKAALAAIRRVLVGGAGEKQAAIRRADFEQALAEQHEARAAVAGEGGLLQQGSSSKKATMRRAF
jgi:transitional endoplasmic reticulum ATPase